MLSTLPIFEHIEDRFLPLSSRIRLAHLLDAALFTFFARILVTIASNPQMITRRYGRVHRVAGLICLGYLMLGIADARPMLKPYVSIPNELVFWYDVGLSVVGFATAFSAAKEFGGAAVHQKGSEASGILDEHATVSTAEMMEHCFYQLLNLCQILYLYAIAQLGRSPLARACLCVLMLLPWLVRGRFPINSFSANYAKPGVGGSTPLIRVLYRMKKYQYVFYKHALLHGVNVTVAIDGGALVATPYFRTYWLCLNIAYVNEFFMQTLVKRRYLSQQWMLALQHVLMAVSTVYAVQILQSVRVLPAMLSLALNFARRGREVSNGLIVLASAVLLSRARGGSY